MAFKLIVEKLDSVAGKLQVKVLSWSPMRINLEYFCTVMHLIETVVGWSLTGGSTCLKTILEMDKFTLPLSMINECFIRNVPVMRSQG